ncbi:MAG: LutC/YkgG family protein [Bacteroidota bacterium]
MQGYIMPEIFFLPINGNLNSIFESKMQESTSREKILKSIRGALTDSMPAPYDYETYADKIYEKSADEIHEVTFAKALGKVNGKFVYNKNEEELKDNLLHLIPQLPSIHCFEKGIQNLLKSAGMNYQTKISEQKDELASVTGCEYLIARTGSIMTSSAIGGGRKGYIYPSVHIVIARRSQLVFDLKDAFAQLKDKYKGKRLPSMITLITGPSRTADIEKTLVMGAHGPEQLFVFFLDQ